MCVIAAVSVVLPWSTCPIVPTFTCGLIRSNLPLAMVLYPGIGWLLIKRRRLCGLLVDHAFGDRLRRLGVVLELHRVRGATLRERAQRGRVAEHLGQRHFGLDDLDARHVVHAVNDAAPRG